MCSYSSATLLPAVYLLERNVRFLAYSRLDSRGRGRVPFAAELPLLYTAGRWPTPPEVNYPAQADESTNKPRRARLSELEAEPFLKSIPDYQYL